MPNDTRSLRVFIIEDNPGDLLLIEEYLSERRVTPEILHASGFSEAASILAREANELDVILLDLTLPDKSGQELVTDMLHLAGNCPVIILTGFSDLDFSISSIAQGIADYMLKDELTAITLHKSIAYCMERRKQLLQLKESELRYSHLFNFSPQARWVYDPKTLKVLQVNKAALDCYGYSEEEFLTMDITDLEKTSNLDTKSVANRLLDANTDGFAGRQKHFKKSGEPLEVEIYSNSIFIDGIEYQSVLAIDISEKILYEHQITRAIIKTQEDERYEVGAELHDNVCQILAGSLMTLRMMKKALEPEGMELFTRLQSYLLLASKEIRNLSHRLAPVFFPETTLEEAFHRVLTEFNAEKKFNLSVSFEKSVGLTEINTDLQLNLYRILQEQLSNILKYSEATSIKVHVCIHNNKIMMQVSDDGVGFNIKRIINGIGISNMKRRTELYFGKFDINSSKGHGCEVMVEIPLTA